MRLFLANVIVAALLVAPAGGQTIYPIDRADILAGARFDLKVEFGGRIAPELAKVTINGADPAAAFGKAASFIAREDDKEQSALLPRGVALPKPGVYTVRASDGSHTSEVTWTVYDTGPRRAKNVILFIGDGMSPAHRVAARILSKRIAQGKSFGKLAIDDMPHMALVSTAGTDSIITDSANSAGTASRSATNIDATVATSAAGSFYRIGLQAGDVGVRSIQTYQQSATWTSGQINLVLYRVIAVAPILAAGVPAPLDWISSGGPRIYDDSCLFFVFVPSTTTTTLISSWSQETSG